MPSSQKWCIILTSIVSEIFLRSCTRHASVLSERSSSSTYSCMSLFNSTLVSGAHGMQVSVHWLVTNTLFNIHPVILHIKQSSAVDTSLQVIQSHLWILPQTKHPALSKSIFSHRHSWYFSVFSGKTNGPLNNLQMISILHYHVRSLVHTLLKIYAVLHAKCQVRLQLWVLVLVCTRAIEQLLSDLHQI